MGISLDEIKIHLSEHYGDGSPHTILHIHCVGLKEFHQNLKPYKYYRPSVEPYQWDDQFICMQIYDPFKNILTFLEKIK